MCYYVPMTSTPSFTTTGKFYAGFLEKRRLPGGGPVYGPDEQEVMESAVKNLLSHPTTSKRPGILLGMIQSGKTKSFLGIIALAFDNGFDVAVILTKPTTALVKQTFKRVRRDFAEFIESDQSKVYDILELPAKLTGFEIRQKLIFVLKKQVNNLDRLREALFSAYPELRGKKILIVDDEADTTSIGYAIGESGDLELRRIAEMIDELRRDLPDSCFLQVTATPYALYLQPEGSPLPGTDLAPVRPKFTDLVPIHKDYVGGDYYFRQSADPESPASFIYKPITQEELVVLRQSDGRKFKIEECLTSDKIPGLRAAIVEFLVGGTIRRIQDDQPPTRRPKRFAFLFHTEAAKSSHAWQEMVVSSLYDHLKVEAATGSKLLERLVKASYEDLSTTIALAGQNLPPYDLVWTRVLEALNEDQITVTKVNSEAQVTTLLDDDGQLGLRNPLNIFIGGQILDRGITIANLIGFFYGRSPQKFQQDTVMQHSRMYGFRSAEDMAVTRLYTAPHIYAKMKRMHEADMALRESLERDGEDQVVKFIQLGEDGSILACNPNKILASNITTLRPHTRLLPFGFQTDYKTRLHPLTEGIDNKLVALLGKIPVAGESPQPTDISLDDALGLIDQLESTFVDFQPGYEETWNVAEFKAILSLLSNAAANPAMVGRVFLVVRTGRHAKRIRDNGKIGDSPDTGENEGLMAKRVGTDVPVLMMIRQEGREADKWRGCPFWWPVLLTPLSTRTTLFARSK